MRIGLEVLLGACAIGATVTAPIARAQSAGRAPATAAVPAAARQLALVITPGWDNTAGTLQRFARTGAKAPWRRVGRAIPVVVGSSGLAWGADSLGGGSDPHKREGDGRSPAGVFPLDTAFGFAAASAMSWVRLPYRPLGAGTECVDDTSSVHYNTIVERGQVPRVDWNSSEHMRRIKEYQVGVLVGYNSRPIRTGGGSCIFLHIWDGPGSNTAGCTAFPRADVERMLAWLDPEKHPVLVQLPSAQYARLKTPWALP